MVRSTFFLETTHLFQKYDNFIKKKPIQLYLWVKIIKYIFFFTWKIEDIVETCKLIQISSTTQISTHTQKIRNEFFCFAIYEKQNLIEGDFVPIQTFIYY